MGGATFGLLFVALRRSRSLFLGIRLEHEGIAADSRGSAPWLDSKGSMHSVAWLSGSLVANSFRIACLQSCKRLLMAPS